MSINVHSFPPKVPLFQLTCAFFSRACPGGLWDVWLFISNSLRNAHHSFLLLLKTVSIKVCGRFLFEVPCSSVLISWQRHCFLAYALIGSSDFIWACFSFLAGGRMSKIIRKSDFTISFFPWVFKKGNHYYVYYLLRKNDLFCAGHYDFITNW